MRTNISAQEPSLARMQLCPKTWMPGLLRLKPQSNTDFVPNFSFSIHIKVHLPFSHFSVISGSLHCKQGNILYIGCVCVCVGGGLACDQYTAV